MTLKMQILISVISGLAGVIIGAFMQILYDNACEKRKTRQDYIKLCISEWIKLKDEVDVLIKNPVSINNILFRQNLLMKIELLSYIGNTKGTIEKVSKIKDKLSDEDERMSLDGKAEECLNIGKNEDNKKILIRDIHNLTSTVLKELKELR